MNISDVEAIVHKPAAWHFARARGIGSSDATKIMAGEWFKLWEEKTGRREPEDLSDIIPVVMGSWTEPLNGWLYERKCGVKLIKGRRIQHPRIKYMLAETDFHAPGNAIVECKHVGQYIKPDAVVGRYYWQCQHQMACTGAKRVYLSVIFGTTTWERFEIERDDEAIAQLEDRCAEFWKHVTDDTPPPDMPAEKVNISLDEMREIDMQESNAWAEHAAGWADNAVAAKAFKLAEKELKLLVEDDVKRAWGHGVEIKRAKNGAMTIREEKT